MTVADNTSRNQYTATSGQTVFAYTFEIVDKDHIVVLQNGTALSEGTDYTVSNVGNDNGGNITLTSGATAGDVMTLYREMPYSRTQNYTNSGDFLASEVNADFDELWLAGEQTDRSFSQSIRKPITDSDSISMELPEAATRANKFVKFDATGAVDVAGATVTVSAEDVSIDDAGNYYTSDNVEGALQEVGASLDTKLENVVEDTTPQLGGNLDVNGNDITGTGNIDLTGNLDVSGTATVGAVTYTGTDGTDGQVLMTDGAGNASFEDMPSSTYLDVKDFGATGNGVDDDTTAIQNAINHASTRGIQTIFFPEGHYKYTTLRFYHDQTDNTAFQGTNLFVGDSTNGTDGTATFAFGWYIADASDLTVTVEGTEQILDTDYTVSGVGSDTGGTITFTAGNVPLAPVGSTVTNRKGDGQTLEFFYSGTVIPDASNVSVTVDGVASTQFTVDIGKRLVVFNAGHEPPAPANPDDNNVVITIQKTVNISSNNRDGRVQLRGTGRLAIADLVGLDKNRTRLYGSVLESTGDGIIIDTDQEFSTPVDARNFVAKDLTFLADNTGQIIKAEKNPGMSFDTCSFKQFNPAGTGLEVRNCWFFTMNQCYVVGQRHIDTFTAVADGSTLEQFTYTFDNPSATSDILVQFNGGALTETTDYTVTMGATKTVTLTATGATKIGAEYTLSGNRTINVQRINTGSGVSSQFVGRSFGNFAGLWTITQSLVDSFANGVHWTGGTVTNFSIRDSAVQNCGNYNIYADEGVIQQLLLDNVYMENQKTQGISFIKGDGSGSSSAVIRNLKMTNCFFLGGGTNPRVTGPCIDLDSVDAINIEGMYHYRVRQPFLNITDTKNFQNVPGEIKNCIFASDSGQTKFLDLEPTVYLLKGVLPNVHNCVWPGFTTDGFYNTTNNILLFDSTVESNFLRQYTDIKGDTGIAKFGFGDTKVVTGITSGPYNITGSDSRTYYDLTHSIAGGLKAILPDTGEFNDGRLIIIKNNEATTSSSQFPYINVVNNSDQSTVIAQLSPGQAGLFIMDKQEGNKFKYVGRAFTDNLDFADNHKISLGRGDSTGADLEIYQHSPSETFADNPAGVTNFIYTFDSPAVSDHIKVERKPEGGSYSNVINFTVNLSTKTVVLGVATTLNEDIRISASESRIDSLDGVVIDGLVYPTADGSVNQVLTTDGSGTLSFANVSGIGINAVVDDTTPQLGGDLESNGNDILFADNDKAIFGAGSDLQIYHDGTHSYIDDAGTGNLKFKSNGNKFNFVNGSDQAAMYIDVDAETKLYYNVSEKLATTSTGIDVTGTVTADGLTVDGQVSQSGAAPSYTIVQTDTTDLNTRFQVNGQSLLFSTINDALNTTTSRFKINNSLGDISFYNSAGTSQDLYWDASTSRLGLGITNPSYDLSVVGSSAAIQVDNTAGSPDQILQLWQADMGTNDRGIQLKSPLTDSNADFFRFATGNSIAFELDGANALSIASNKRIGIGTDLPSHLLDVEGVSDPSICVRSTGTATTDDALMRIEVGGTTASSYLMFGDADDSSPGRIRYVHSDDSMRIYAGGAVEKVRFTSNQTLFYNGATEAARFDSTNNFLVGTTSTSPHTTSNPAEGGLRVSQGGMLAVGRNSNPALNVNRITDDGLLAMWYRNGVNVGNISVTSSATTYNTSSDQRLKDNIVDAPSASDDIDAIQVRSFDWKADGSHQKYGMVAQELQTVAPDAVSEGDTEEDMMGVDYSKLVPMLVKEIQSLRARVAQLEND